MRSVLTISRLSNQGKLFPLVFFLVIHFFSPSGDGFWASPGESLAWVPVLGAGPGPPDCLNHLLTLHLEQSQVRSQGQVLRLLKSSSGPPESSGPYTDPSGGLRGKSSVGERHGEDGGVASMLTAD